MRLFVVRFGQKAEIDVVGAVGRATETRRVRALTSALLPLLKAQPRPVARRQLLQSSRHLQRGRRIRRTLRQAFLVFFVGLLR